MSGHLDALAERLDEEQRRALVVIACEQRITPSMLGRLNLTGDIPVWLADWTAQGLLVDAGVVHGLAFTRSISGERALAIAPSYRPLLLRHLAQRGALERAKQDSLAAVGHGAVAGFMTALYSGNLQLLQTELNEMLHRSEPGDKVALVRSRLNEAVCSPFQPDTLIRTWGESAWIVIEQALLQASASLEPITDVYRWAVSRIQELPNPRTLRILTEHAILRGDHATISDLRSRLPAAERLPVHAVEVFLRGDVAGAQGLLDDLDASKQKNARAVPCSTSVTALLTLLALSRTRPAGAALARRVMPRVSTGDASPIPGWPLLNSQLATVRALRVLMRSLTQPGLEMRRLSPHHLGPETPVWQTLTTALTVLVEDCDATTRIAWTRRLQEDARRWSQRGYDWVARQAWHLAGSLSGEPEAEPESPAPSRVGEPLLSLLLEREPEWRIAMRAVDKLLQSVEREEVTVSRRVAWYVDTSSGELAKPALEEYRSAVGWTQARRLDFKELRSIKDKLPPEDAAVLTVIDSASGAWSPPQALEALCGHPRVFNGVRGRQRVEVVRGTCRVETHRDRGHLVIRVEPAGASEGMHVVVESETRVVVYRINDAFAKLLQALPCGIPIPESHLDQARALLARLSEHVHIHSPELGACRVAVADSTPCLRISPEAGAWWLEVGVRPFGEFGRFFPPGLGRLVVIGHADGELFDTERDVDQEIAHYHALLDSCPTLVRATQTEEGGAGSESEHPYGFSLSAEDLYCLLSELRNSGQSCNLEWQNCSAISARGKVTAAALQGSLRRIKGWYLFDGTISLDDVSRIELADLVRMPFTKSGRFIRLPSGDFLEVERRIAQVLMELARVAQLPPRGAAGELKIPDAAISTVRALVDAGSSLDVDASVTDWGARIDAILGTKPAVPAELSATLRSYQLDGYRWLYRHSQLGFGVCLSDDMGVGKTVQVIALLLTRAAGGPALVVAPTSVCSNWIDELHRFAPSLAAAEYTGRSRSQLLDRVRNREGEKPLDVLVTSYALLQQDAAPLASVRWHTAVIDEAQFIKNPNSLRAKAAFQLCADYRVAMTGTPVENHLGDLWSIFHFLNPALLGSFRHFQLSYLRPIERDQSTEQRTLLKRLVQPFLLRRRKSEVLQELPPTTTLRHEVRLSEDEALRYTLLRRQIHDKLWTPHGKRQHKLQILAEITRLRRFCCHPRLVFPDAPTESSKLQAFLELVEELRDNGHRALVFSQFVDFLELVRAQLDERGFRYVYLDGATPKEARSERVRVFQTGESELFLISLKAGGFGLNLTAADYVIHLDPWWNPAVEAQATDRAHRIGQERPVTVYRLITKDSIEERIIELHQEKRALADSLLDGGQGAQSLSGDELLALLDAG